MRLSGTGHTRSLEGDSFLSPVADGRSRLLLARPGSKLYTTPRCLSVAPVLRTASGTMSLIRDSGALTTDPRLTGK
jgi:hypothetical protein